MIVINLNTIPDIYLKDYDMIYWTSKRSGVSVRFRAYKVRQEGEDYSLLDRKPLAEVYIFLHKENHGSCMGMIKGKSIQHYKSKDQAFEEISKELKEIERKRKT